MRISDWSSDVCSSDLTPDYYSKDEYKDLRNAYLAHIARVFELTGVTAVEAAKKADGILAFETRLAGASLSRVELRDPKNQYHFMPAERSEERRVGKACAST